MKEEIKSTPPKATLRLLSWFCPEHLYESIEGDLIQKFYREVKSSDHLPTGQAGSKWSDDYTLRRAKRRLLWNVIRFFRPEIVLRNKFSTRFNQLPMFQNYFKTSIRHILKSKVNFAFKLSGLALALFSFLIISIYVTYQLSFDRFHEDYENIYRVNSQWMENGKLSSFGVVPTGVGPALKAELPEIKSFARISHPSKYLIKYKDKALRMTGIATVDSTIFDVFTIKFIRGDRHALRNPQSIILTESMAKQIFGDEDPIHKSISFVDHGDEAFEVAALIEDFPTNSHLDIRALLPHRGLSNQWELDLNPWEISIDGSTLLYIKFNKPANLKSFYSKAEPIIRKNITSADDDLAKNYRLFLQPVKDIYLADRIQVEFTEKGNAVYVYVFSLLGIFLLAIASINYINLSVADFHKRNKEIGIRKVLGARKKQIAFQVTFETILFCLLAGVISVGILYFAFPQLLQLLDPALSFGMLMNPEVLLLLGITFAILIIFSTIYPAYQLTRNNIALDLKSNTGLGIKSRVDQSLLLIQFVISIICISATF
ncbi:MAG TPA: FtsX-like permease family protein, partial [Cyclobacteriaceae bacterium]